MIEVVSGEHPRVLFEPGRVTLHEVERVLVVEAIKACRGNKKSAARTLGISRSALYAKLHRFGLGSTCGSCGKTNHSTDDHAPSPVSGEQSA